MDTGWTTIAKVTDDDGDTLRVEARTRDITGSEGLLFTTDNPMGVILTWKDIPVVIEALSHWLNHPGEQP